MKIFKKLWNKLFKKEIECDQDTYCPIYLSYLGKYGDNNDETKHCKNKNKHYCKKYRLIDETEWKKLSDAEKMKIVIDMHLIDFIDKK